MALKPMWSCSLQLGACVKGCLWRGFGSVYHKWQEMHSWHKRQRIQSCGEWPTSHGVVLQARPLPLLHFYWPHDIMTECRRVSAPLVHFTFQWIEFEKSDFNVQFVHCWISDEWAQHFHVHESWKWNLYNVAEINISYSLKVIIEY